MAAEILAACRAGLPWRDETLAELVQSGSPELFRDLVEPLCDAFEPRLCGVYADLFTQVIATALPEMDAQALRARYERVRHGDPSAAPAARDVCVLSRVTLGADIAVTSGVLDWARRRFPDARLHFVGPRKNYELFDADARIAHVDVPYGRHASIADRLRAGLGLADLLPAGALAIDPDSRLTQLGLLPVCEEDHYCFFESRSYGAASDAPLSVLTRQWLGGAAVPFLAPRAQAVARGRVAVSLGVGGNAAKRVADPFEELLLGGLVKRGLPLLVDHGAGGEEAARVDRAIAASGAAEGQIETWSGAFAPFAASIAASSLYVGYDSSGQHVAAALGTPLVTIFAGEPNQRFFARWRPAGPGLIETLRAAPGDDPHELAARALDAVERIRNEARERSSWYPK